MFKRYSIFALVGAGHFIALIGPLSFIVGIQNLSAQQQVAQDAYAIFEGSCLICHGPDGAYRETLLMEHRRAYRRGHGCPGKTRMPPSCTSACLETTERRWGTDAVRISLQSTRSVD